MFRYLYNNVRACSWYANVPKESFGCSKINIFVESTLNPFTTANVKLYYNLLQEVITNTNRKTLIIVNNIIVFVIFRHFKCYINT